MADNPCECNFDDWPGDTLDGKKGIYYNFYASDTGEDNIFLDTSDSEELCIFDALSGNGEGEKQQRICTTHKKTERRFAEIKLGDIELTGNVPTCGEIDEPQVTVGYGSGEKCGPKWSSLLAQRARGPCNQHFIGMGDFNKFTVADLPECILPHKKTMVDIVAGTHNPCSGGGTLKLVTAQNIVCNSGTATVYAIAKGVKGDVQSESFSSCFRGGVPKGTSVATRKLQCFPGTPPDIKYPRIVHDADCDNVANNCCSPQEPYKFVRGSFRYCGSKVEMANDANAVFCQGQLTYGKGYCVPFEPYVKVENDGQHIAWGGTASKAYFHSNIKNLLSYPTTIGELKALCSKQGPFMTRLFFQQFPKNRPPGTPCLPDSDRRSIITAVNKIPKMAFNKLKSAISKRNADLSEKISKARADAIAKYNAKFPNCPFTDIEIHLSTFEAPSISVGGFTEYSTTEACGE